MFSLALVQGEPGSRRCLVYAHSPVEGRTAVEITIPDYRNVTVDVPRQGGFCLIEERGGRSERVAGG